MEPIEQLREAIENEGPKPRYHREIMKRHRKEWPTLWAVIDRLIALEAREATVYRDIWGSQKISGHVEPGTYLLIQL